MTPLEAGLGGWAWCFFGGGFLLGGRPLWGALVVAAPVGAHLGGYPGNATLVTGGGHLGVAPPGGYELGHLGGGTPAGDFKFLTFLLLGGAALAFLRGRAEFESLLVGSVAVLAGLLTFSVDSLLFLYLSLELQALAVYTLVGLYRFEEERTDSALKYLLSGSLVSGFMLLGFARWYGLHGGFHLAEPTGSADPVGSAWVTGVLLFKAGVVPFHFWTPLAYTPLEWGTLAVVLGAAKVNVWYLLAFNLGGFQREAWWPAWWAGVASVGVGALGGYFQTGVGGLLAYSGVLNGGYLVLLVLAARDGGFLFGYYAGVYLVGTLGVVLLASAWGDTRVAGFARWGHLGVAVPLLLYYAVLSLAGLPVFPGFFAKVALLVGLGGFGFFFVGALVAASVVPAVYYAGLAGASLFSPAGDLGGTARPTPAGVAAGVVLLDGGIRLVGSLV